jgi:hypothetical protein
MTPFGRFVPGQRVVIVVGLGAALLFVGDYVTSLGAGLGDSAPLLSSSAFYASAGLNAGVQLLVWLVLVAVWAAVSLFILRSRAEVPGDDARPASPANGTPD